IFEFGVRKAVKVKVGRRHSQNESDSRPLVNRKIIPPRLLLLIRNILSVATLWLRFRGTEKDRSPHPSPPGRVRGRLRVLGPQALQCYPASIASPVTGGADDLLHSTAGIHRWTRRRGGMAACRARSATRDAGDWVSERQDGGLRRLGAGFTPPEPW